MIVKRRPRVDGTISAARPRGIGRSVDRGALGGSPATELSSASDRRRGRRCDELQNSDLIAASSLSALILSGFVVECSIKIWQDPG